MMPGADCYSFCGGEGSHMPNLLVPNVNEQPISSTFSPLFGLWGDTDPSYMHAQANTLEKKLQVKSDPMCTQSSNIA